jgi:hypothetical protein
MYERIVWQYWENSDTYPNSIPYIDLCHETVDLHQTDGKGYKVIRLNDKNYHEYIDDINPFIFNLKESENQLAQKADYIRAKLLYKHGGIWLDSDAIVFRDLDMIFDKLEHYEFYGYKINSPCIWAFACHKNAEIMKKWVDNNDKVLNESEGKNIFYGELGHRSFEIFIDTPNIFLDDATKVQSIDHRYAWKYMHFTNGLEKFINDEQPFFMMNNALICDYIKKYTREELKNSNILISQFLMKAGVKF